MDQLDRLVQWLRFLLEGQLGLLDRFLLADLLNLWLRLLQWLPVGQLDRLLLVGQLGRLDLLLLVDRLDQWLQLFLVVRLGQLDQ